MLFCKTLIFTIRLWFCFSKEVNGEKCSFTNEPTHKIWEFTHSVNHSGSAIFWRRGRNSPKSIQNWPKTFVRKTKNVTDFLRNLIQEQIVINKLQTVSLWNCGLLLQLLKWLAESNQSALFHSEANCDIGCKTKYPLSQMIFWASSQRGLPSIT